MSDGESGSGSDELRRDLEAFYAYLEHERHASPRTLSSYRGVLERTYAILRSAYPELTSFTGLGRDHMRRLAREFNFDAAMQELSSATVAHSIYALSSFFRFMILKGRLQNNPVQLIRAPRVRRSLPQVLTLSEMLTLLDGITPASRYQVRDLCMAELLFSTGLRVAELVSLDLGSVDFAQRELRVLGKGSKERVVPVGRPALHSLTDYLRVRDEFRPRDEALFVSRVGRRITTRGVEQNLCKLATLAGLEGRVTPHRFRHAFATELLAHGADLRTVQELLGHASLSATQIYTHVDLEHMRLTYSRAHPRALRPDAAGGTGDRQQRT